MASARLQTGGLHPGYALAQGENQQCVGSWKLLLNPGFPLVQIRCRRMDTVIEMELRQIAGGGNRPEAVTRRLWKAAIRLTAVPRNLTDGIRKLGGLYRRDSTLKAAPVKVSISFQFLL